MAVIKRFPQVAPLEKPAQADGRSLLATGRTVQFATRVHPAWKERLHKLAQSRGWMYVEILEKALDSLERELAREETAPPARAQTFLD